MKITDITSALERISADQSSSERKVSRIDFVLEADERYFLLRRGWWHTLVFGKDRYYFYGLRIMPGIPSLEWPVVRIIDHTKAFTYAPSIRRIFLFHETLLFFQDKAAAQERLDNWENYLESIRGFLVLLIAQDEISGLKELLRHIIASTVIDAPSIYGDFWKKHESHGQFALFEKFFSMLREDMEIGDNLIFREFGIWQTRVWQLMSVILMKKWLSGKPIPEKASRALIKNIEPFDVEHFNYQIFPNEASNLYVTYPNMLNVVQNNLNNEFGERQILENIISAFQKEGKNRYSGLQHMEAAAVYDSQFKNPGQSWKFLTNTAYWSGKNKEETLLPAWKAAIYLSEKEGWSEVQEALIYQYEFYKEHAKSL